MARFTNLLAAFAASTLVITAMSTAQAADMHQSYGNFDDAICGHTSVRSVISNRFHHQVTHVPNTPNVNIVGFHDAQLVRHEPAAPDSPIERRYCSATVSLSDGYSRQISYLIEYGQGFASIGDNVEFCIDGFDRWNVYNSRCRVLR